MMINPDSAVGKLAREILLSLMKNPSINEEDYKHNAVVAIRQAQAFLRELDNPDN